VNEHNVISYIWPGNQWWNWIPDCDCTFILEIINFKIYWGFIFGICMPLFVLCDITLNRLVLRYYYRVYLPEYS